MSELFSGDDTLDLEPEVISVSSTSPSSSPEDSMNLETESQNVCSQNCTPSQPTQPIESGTLSQTILNSMDERKPWGYLMCEFPKNKCIPLIKDEFIVGRDTTRTDHAFDRSLGHHVNQVSRKHFRIIRVQDGEHHIVSIEDLSAGGTFVNGILIGKNRKRPLFHRDEISILHTLEIKVFVFSDLQFGRSVPDSFPREVASNYTVMEDIDKGAFGNVYLVVKHTTGQKLAMKAIQLKLDQLNHRSDTNLPFNETNIMYSVRHMNIVRVHEVYCNEKHLFILMEFVSGGNLHCYLRDRETNLREMQAKFIFYQLVQAVAYLHEKKIVHRDIKLLNILCSKKDSNFPLVKLTDFGQSKFLRQDIEQVHTFCGTRGFAAPEVNPLFWSNPQGKNFDARCDVWSLGLIFYVCLSGNMPFKQDDNKPSLEYQIRKCVVEFHPADVWRSVTTEAKLLIRSMIKKDFLERPASIQLLQKSYFVDDMKLRNYYDRLVSNNQEQNPVEEEEFEDENHPKKIPRLN